MASFQAEKAAAHRSKVSNQKLFSSMTKVYHVNRQHDHELEVELEDIRKTEHMESVRRYSDIRRLQRTLSDMRLEKNRLTLTFTPEELRDGDAAPVMSWKKIQTHRMQTRPRAQRRSTQSEGTKALMAVAENAEFSAKNKFRSAIMAVCLSKALSRIVEESGEGDANADQGNESEASGQMSKSDANSYGKAEGGKETENQEKGKVDNEEQNKEENDTGGELDIEKEKSQLSVIDIIRNRTKNNNRANYMDAERKAVSVPTFGQLHQAPRRRSSRTHHQQQRRPSTVNAADVAKNSTSFVLDNEGKVRRLRRVGSGVERDVEPRSMTTERRLSRSQHSNNLWQVGPGMGSKVQMDISSFQRKKRNELARQSEDTMKRIRKFLNSSLPK